MSRHTPPYVGYGNTRYSRTVRRPPPRRRSRAWTFVPVAILLAGAWYGYNWYQDVLAGKQDCWPLCGILPGPGGAPIQTTFKSARGWRVTYRPDWFGRPSRKDGDGIEWRRDNTQSVGLVTTSESDPKKSCEAAAAALPGGFEQIFSIPNAGIGDQVGVGAAFEKTIARPGKSPTRLRYFQICVTAGKVSLLGFAEGPRERTPTAYHADPATTRTAFLLGELAAGVEYVDKQGEALSRSGRGLAVTGSPPT